MNVDNFEETVDFPSNLMQFVSLLEATKNIINDLGYILQYICRIFSLRSSNLAMDHHIYIYIIIYPYFCGFPMKKQGKQP